MWASNKLGVPVLGNLLRPCNVLELFRKKQFAHRLAGTSVTEFSLSLCCYSFLGALWHLFQRLIWKSSKGNILAIISFLWGIFFFLVCSLFVPFIFTNHANLNPLALLLSHSQRNQQPARRPTKLIKNYLRKRVCWKFWGKYTPESIWQSATKKSVAHLGGRSFAH